MGGIPPISGWIITSADSNNVVNGNTFTNYTLTRLDMAPCAVPQSVSILNGNWSSPATWLGGMVPPADADVTVNSTVTVDAPVRAGSIEIGPAGTVNTAAGGVLKVDE